MSDNWIYDDHDRKLHKAAKEYFEKHKEELRKRPVRYVPMGFSYEREKLKNNKEQVTK